ncbi:MAG: LipL32 family surface lipoprotein [Bacteroidota bacterium]|jgi:hypothetical protein
MKKKGFLFACAIVCLIGSTALAQKLDKFAADLGKKSVMGKEIRVPYTDVISYFGFVNPGSAPDEERNGKKYYYLYVWVPAVAPEIGVRMISPVPDNMKPEPTDVVTALYTEKGSDKSSYFDTWISFEKAQGIVSLEDVLPKGKSANWVSIQQNDDSGEMPAQPSGNKYNSLLRITSEVSDPLKALTVGLYRIGFTTYKVGEVQGSFMAQVGAPVKLPGVRISNTLQGLVESMEKK